MKNLLLTTAVVLFTAFHVNAQQEEVFTLHSQAIRGYDPVAYFKEAKPVKGSDEYSFKWKDANWFFSSKENLDSFSLNPEKYAPQYGGYCAYGLSEGHKAPTDPNAWTIVDGKLYFNYSLKVKELWIKNPTERIEKADKNWPMLKDKE
jgi:YHS domain-containing protein